MDNLTDSASSQPAENQSETELSHSDKMIGIFTEPGKTFESMAKFPPKTIDWILPILLLIVVIIATQFVVMHNSELKYQMQQKQLEKVQKSFDQMVAKGQMTRSQANDRINQMQDGMAQGPTPVQMILQDVGILIFVFIVFFFMAGIYLLLILALKGVGGYVNVLVASGMTAYIAIISIILSTILAFILAKPMQDTSVAAFLNTDRTTVTGFIFSKLDIFSIWGYVILSIGLAQLFKSSSTTKYYFVVFGVWLIGGVLFFLLAKAVPFLGFFLG